MAAELITTAELFKNELTAYVEVLIADSNHNWRNLLENRIDVLFAKYIFKSKTSFTIGEDISENSNPSTACDDLVQTSHLISNVEDVEQSELSAEDEFVLKRLRCGELKHRELEKKCDAINAVRLRRKYLEEELLISLDRLPFKNYDYKLVNGACCENIIGLVQVPVGIAGPLIVNNYSYYIPMATTEGALIASTNRGCKAINESGGVKSFVFKDRMTRAPVLRFQSVREAVECRDWLQQTHTFHILKKIFDGTSRFARLIELETYVDGLFLHICFGATTGDAMGMNMVTKGVTPVVDYIIRTKFPTAKLDAISGNSCSDKKASAKNWIDGRGKSVCAEVIISKDIVKNVLKTDVDTMVRVGQSKLQSGARCAVSIGGSNAHAANIVAATFLATGQDLAQVISSGMCSTNLSKDIDGNLHVACTMNVLEVGTIGGGTFLDCQQTCLRMLQCDGPNAERPGDNARRLASIICSTVLAGELSLLACQCSGDLVKSHLTLNRSNLNLCLLSKSTMSLRDLQRKSSAVVTSRVETLRSSVARLESVVNNNRHPEDEEAIDHRKSSTLSATIAKTAKKSMGKCDQSFT